MGESLKTPITYYGGKQTMLSMLLPLVPQHKVYTEAFVGGGALFWAKPKATLEVVNDINQMLVTFYRVCQTNYKELERMVKSTLHSRKLHRHAYVIYTNPELFSDLQIAWAVWVLSTQGFSGQLAASWGYDKSNQTVCKKITNKKREFTDLIMQRMEGVQVECTDAAKVIRIFDSPDTFHYVDPPYYNSACGHYDGYTEGEYRQLLETLAGVKGKFLLSSYPSAPLDEFVQAHGWHQLKVNKRIAVSGAAKGTKTEVLTANYPLKAV